MKKFLVMLLAIVPAFLFVTPAYAATEDKDDLGSCSDGNKDLWSNLTFTKKDSGTQTTSDDEVKIKENGTGGLLLAATINHDDSIHYVEFVWKKLNGNGDPVTVDESGWLQPAGSFINPVYDFGADYVAYDNHPWLRVHARWTNGDQCSFNMAWNSGWE